MPQFIVNVDRLNKRNAVPASFSDKTSVIGVVNLGFRFEGEEVTGVPNAAPGPWYKDRDGSFYWGGGLKLVPVVAAPGLVAPAAAPVPVAAVPPAVPAVAPGQPGVLPDYFNLTFLPDKMSWAHNFLGIPMIWKDIATAGKDVIVAVVDSGVDVAHPDLQDAILPQSISISVTGEIDDSSPLPQRLKDNVGHGTQMAGIIAAAGKSLVYGVAPVCKLLVVKFTDVDSNLPAAALTKAFEWLSTQTLVEVDIISASLTVDKGSSGTALQSHVKACIDKGIPVFSAIGDLHLAPKDDDDCFPACYDNCTAIGSFDPAGKLCGFSNWNSHLSLVAPGDLDVMTAGVGNTTSPGAATSIATAVAAGCHALLISFLKQRQGAAYSGKATDHLQKLYDNADDIGNSIGKDHQSGFGRINLRNTISTIKNLTV